MNKIVENDKKFLGISMCANYQISYLPEKSDDDSVDPPWSWIEFDLIQNQIVGRILTQIYGCGASI